MKKPRLGGAGVCLVAVSFALAAFLKTFAAFGLLLLARLLVQPLNKYLPRWLTTPVDEDRFAYVRALKRFDAIVFGWLGRLWTRRQQQEPPAPSDSQERLPPLTARRRDSQTGPQAPARGARAARYE